jgi:quinoprotein glucose dehydrogenase
MPKLTLLCLLALAAGFCACQTSRSHERTDWRFYLGDPASSQYSPLTRIDTANVDRLILAWRYNAGDARENDRSQIQCSPIVVDSVLYATSPQLKLLALHAETGRLLWQFDPFSDGRQQAGPGLNRGVMYWQEGSEQRIFYSAGPTLYGLHALTGNPVPSFGNGGMVDLRAGLGRDVGGLVVTARTPGVIYQDLFILGSSLGEGPSPAAPGHIRAFSARTGEIEWIFHTIPQPGEFGYETWPPDAWMVSGGANAWAGMSLDERRGVVYIPTGSATFDFWGGDRKGANLFANCILALDARTGERIWHFQTVHHDIWDRDLPMPPNLVTVHHDGQQIDAVAQLTKTGHIFLLHRDTGKPLFPVEDIAIPQSDLLGEQAWPTQPLPVRPPPLSRQWMTASDITDISEQAHAFVKKRYDRARTGGPFMPMSTQGTVIFPGFDGGGEWGGAAYDAATGWLYANTNEMAWIMRMVPTKPPLLYTLRDAGDFFYAGACASCHGVSLGGNSDGTFPPLTQLSNRFDREQLRQLIVQGRGRMQGFPIFDVAQQDALLAYLLDLDDGEFSSSVKDVTIDRTMLLQPFRHTGYNRLLDREGYPGVKPPWGKLNAVDLNSGEIVWQKVLGEYEELTARGIAATGTENYGGPVVTAGGLIFIGATKDEKFRAFNKRTGELLWQTALPAAAHATPCTYEIAGRQFVVVACGGGKGTKSGDAYVAFALPED